MKTTNIDYGKKQAAIVLSKQEIGLISETLAEAVFQGADKDLQILSDQFCKLNKQSGVTN